MRIGVFVPIRDDGRRWRNLNWLDRWRGHTRHWREVGNVRHANYVCWQYCDWRQQQRYDHLLNRFHKEFLQSEPAVIPSLFINPFFDLDLLLRIGQQPFQTKFNTTKRNPAHRLMKPLGTESLLLLDYFSCKSFP